MEDAAKALYMAGALLIALLIISLLVYAFGDIGKVEKEKDKIAQQEELAKFNTEYEAFNKKLMYGVDVISCINKAVSNNEKQFKEGKWSTVSGASSEETLIQISVHLSSKLKESYQIFYVNDKGREAKLYADEKIKPKIKESFEKFVKNKYGKDKNLTNVNFIKLFIDKEDYIYTDKLKNKKLSELFSNSENFKTFEEFEIDNMNGWMYLLKPNNESGDINPESAKKEYRKFNNEVGGLYTLSKSSNNLKLVCNNDLKTDKTWSSIVWTTAISDFKSRKFTCKEINYNKETGRIDRLTFEEK